MTTSDIFNRSSKSTNKRYITLHPTNGCTANCCRQNMRSATPCDRCCSVKQYKHQHPKYGYHTMGDKQEKQQDIRKWIGSPQSGTSGTPARRRRVMSTSDSEAEKENRPIDPQQDQHQEGGNPQVPTSAAAGNGASAASCNNSPISPEVIELASSSDDSMYVPLSRRNQSGGAARLAERNNQSKRTRGQANNQRCSGGRRVGIKRSRKIIPKYSVEAEETSDSGSSLANCVESDTDAQDLYRQAISGVRNAGNARSNHRRSSMHCAVCAKFAEYLQHFL